MNVPMRFERLDPSNSYIRLLHLFPSGQGTKYIRVDLEVVVSPSVVPPYEALSYCWGDRTNPRRIQTGHGFLEVTENLHDALYHLRLPGRSRTLWVDAVCINQKDDWEKSHQVRQMGDIYRGASRVLVWLGPSDQDVTDALSFVCDTWENRQIRELPVAGLEKIYKNPWWSRMWVMQEMVIPRQDPIVHLGYDSVPWSAVASTLFQICWNELDSPHKYRLLDNTEAMFFFCLLRDGVPTDQDGLEMLLLATANRHAGDPHDYIYALLGMLPEKQLPLTDVNYSQPARFCYQDAMVGVCNFRQDLDWLLFAAAGQDVLLRAQPSWCIDFRGSSWLEDNIARGTYPTATSQAHFGCSRGRSMVPPLHDKNAGILVVSGIRIGTIDFEVTSTTSTFRSYRHASVLPVFLEVCRRLEFQSAVKHLIEDVGKFAILAEDALVRRVGPAVAAEKISRGDSWKVAAEGRDVRNLLDEHERRQNGDDAEKAGLAMRSGKALLSGDPDMTEQQDDELERTAMGRDGYAFLQRYASFVTDDGVLAANGWTESPTPAAEDPDDTDDNAMITRMFTEFFTTASLHISSDGTRHFTAADPAQREARLQRAISRPIGEEELAAAAALTEIAYHTSNCGSYFTTDSGYIGIANHVAQEGDVVCIFFGCKRPAILRPLPDGSHVLVAFAYVDDVMDGEFLSSAEGAVDEIFVLR